jgi:hypothetical protein
MSTSHRTSFPPPHYEYADVAVCCAHPQTSAKHDSPLPTDAELNISRNDGSDSPLVSFLVAGVDTNSCTVPEELSSTTGL